MAADTIGPGGDGMRRRIDSAVTLLPQPDSPTIAKVSPGMTWNETPSTARTMPSRVKNQVLRSATSSNGRPAGAGAGRGAAAVAGTGSATAAIAPLTAVATGADRACRAARRRAG